VCVMLRQHEQQHQLGQAASGHEEMINKGTLQAPEDTLQPDDR
jgi:hypothetical protein